MKCILLTGAGGMVGRNVRGHSLANGFEWLTPGSNELNLADEQAVLAYVKTHKPDCVIHAAGLVGGIQANMADPVRFLVENLRIGVNLLTACKTVGIPQVINLGSSCMYPREASNPLKEEAVLTGELEPTNEGYALAKIVAARLCDYISQEAPELSYKTVIPCNLYGRYDHFEPNRSHMIPAVIHKLHQAKLSGSDVVDIWGDGLSRREFMYAEDLAHFLFYALDHFETMPNMLNVGLGQDWSINDYYQAASIVVGYEGGFTHDLSKPAGMRQKLVDTQKLAQFGWSAPTSLEQGLTNTYQFYLEKLND
jgi:nucleoside-diphosphate-sugar epimerase